MTIKDLSNCDELINTLVDYYHHTYDYSESIINFQGDRIYFEGAGIYSTSTVILKDNYIFFVSAPYDNYDYQYNGAKTIDVQICRSGENIDQIPTAVIPAYVREELIATLKGEW